MYLVFLQCILKVSSDYFYIKVLHEYKHYISTDISTDHFCMFRITRIFVNLE
jgi:hypothetical protein